MRHLGFKLPAEGGSFKLLDAFGSEIDRVVYARQAEGVSRDVWMAGYDSSVFRPNEPWQSNRERSTEHRLEQLLTSSNAAGWMELFNPQPVSIEPTSFVISPDGGKAGVPRRIAHRRWGYCNRLRSQKPGFHQGRAAMQSAVR